MMVWSETSVSECPGCGATVAVGILSLCVTCKIDGYYYVDIDHIRKGTRALRVRGWYTSREAYERGDPPIRGWK